MLINQSCDRFISLLASAEPVPGGGGAAALCGALGAALCAMAARLTVGKKKFAPYAAELDGVIADADALCAELLSLIDGDARGFAPLAAAYALPTDAPDRDSVLAAATLSACRAPKRMMELCVCVTELLETLHNGRCSALLVSDLGCAAALTEAAMQSAAMNVFVNTRTLRGDDKADAMDRSAREQLAGALPRLRKISQDVLQTLTEV